MIEKFEYKNERTIQEHQIIMRGDETNNGTDDLRGTLSLTVAQLKIELFNRGLKRKGNKSEPLKHLLELLEHKNW